MRTFEILLITSTIIGLIFWRKKTSVRSVFALLLGLCALAHLMLEGWRWQLIPVYLVIAFLLFSLVAKNVPRRLSLGISVIFILFSWVLASFIPVPKHPDITGQYSVGIDLLEVERSRDKQKIPVKVWFPRKEDSLETQPLVAAPWVENLDVFGRVLSQRAGLPEFSFAHLSHFNAGHYAQFSTAVNTDQPLILLAHGRGGFKALNSFMAMEFASRGYIVIAPDFPGGSLLTILRDGTQIPFDPAIFAEDKEYTEADEYRIIQALGQSWRDDLSTVMTSIRERFPHLTAKKKVVSGGHSTGAAAAINYCNSSSDCLATIALDAWLKPVENSLLKNGSTKPILALFGDQASGDFKPINQERFKQLETASTENGILIQNIEIKKARHIDFCDAALLSPYSYFLGQQKGKIQAHQVMQLINLKSSLFINKLIHEAHRQKSQR